MMKIKQGVLSLPVLLAVAACRGCATAADAAAAEPERPNIILCMTDNQGWGDVGLNGLAKI